MGSVLSKPDRLPVESLLLDVADVLATSLDLDTTVSRVAEVVRKVIDYEIFAILLLYEKTQDLRFRFQVGYPPEFAERTRIKVGEGVTGLAAQTRQAVLIDDVTLDPRYIEAVPNVRSELAIPLITKNRVIGVIDIEAREPGYFTEEHKRVLTLVASRMAAGIENAQLYTRTKKQARILLLLNEIARELTSILNLDELLGRIAELIRRLIDYQMFSILLLDAAGEKLQHRFSLRFNENIHLKREIPLGRGLVGAAAESKEAVLVPDVSKDPRYVEANPETRSELAVPLIYKDKVIGVLDLEHTRRGFFTEEHQRTMTTLAAQIAIAIENARLYEEIERQERRLERDLALARELQGRLLPQTRPSSLISMWRRNLFQRAPSAEIFTISFRYSHVAARHCHWRRQRQRRAGGHLCGAGQRDHSLACADRTGPAEMLSAVNLFAGRAPHRGAVRLHHLCGLGRRAPHSDGREFRPAAPDLCARRQESKSSKRPACLSACSTRPNTTSSIPHEARTTCSCSSATAFSTPATARANCSDAGGSRQIIAECAGKSADCVVDSLFKAAAEHSAGVETFDDQTVVAIRVRRRHARSRKRK